MTTATGDEHCVCCGRGLWASGPVSIRPGRSEGGYGFSFTIETEALGWFRLHPSGALVCLACRVIRFCRADGGHAGHWLFSVFDDTIPGEPTETETGARCASIPCRIRAARVMDGTFMNVWFARSFSPGSVRFRHTRPCRPVPGVCGYGP
jgi:hypothetical protein